MEGLQEAETYRPEHSLLVSTDEEDDFQVNFRLPYHVQAKLHQDEERRIIAEEKLPDWKSDALGVTRSTAIQAVTDEPVWFKRRPLLQGQVGEPDYPHVVKKEFDFPDSIELNDPQAIEDEKDGVISEKECGPFIDQIKKLKLQVSSIQSAFEELSNLRNTVPEIALIQYKETITRCTSIADDEIRLLRCARQENEKTIQELRSALTKAHVMPPLSSGPLPNPSHSNDIYKNQKSETIRLSEARQIRTMYEDLTGLLFTDISASEDARVYDCIQTGRNGTLHYKLFQPKGSDRLHYKPAIDEQRDASLLAYLPEYLTSDIEFSRDRASLFFWRLISYLQSNRTQNAKSRK